MIVTIKTVEGELKLSNDNMDNLNFVELTIGEMSQEVNLDDLFSALIAFDSNRSRRAERDKEYDD